MRIDIIIDNSTVMLWININILKKILLVILCMLKEMVISALPQNT